MEMTYMVDPAAVERTWVAVRSLISDPRGDHLQSCAYLLPAPQFVNYKDKMV